MKRSGVSALAALGFLLPSHSFAQLPTHELYSRLPKQQLVDAAREVAATDPVAALVTVDSKGRPRARSVEVHWEEIVLTDPPLFGHNPPEGARRETDRIMLWIATRPGTRKLEQIAANPRVALYFEDDASGSYLSVMGWAEIITEPRVVTTQSWHSEEQLAEFYPSFPDDMVLIRVDVSWLEVIAPGIDASTDLWRPQAAVLQAETPDPE